MAYIGQQPVVGRYILLDQISGGFNGTTSGFTMSTAGGVQGVKPGLAQNVLLSLGGVIQQPGVDYTISGSGITFTTPPVSGTTFFATVLGDAQSVGTPSDGTVTPASIASGFDFGFPNVNVTGVITIASGSAAVPSLTITGDVDTGLFSPAANTVAVTTSGVQRLSIGSSEAVFNEGSNDVDFRVESNGNTHMLFVDGGNDRVGIGTSSPENNLHVADTSGPIIRLTNSTGSDGSFTGRISTGDAAGTFFAGINFFKHDTNDGEIRFRTKHDGTNKDTVTIVDHRVGIGTTSPQSELTVRGSTPQITLEPTADTQNCRLQFATTDGTIQSFLGGGGSDGAALRFLQSTTERARIDSAGRLLIGHSSSRSVDAQMVVQIEGTTQQGSSMSLVRNSNDAAPPNIVFGKSRGTSTGSNTVVQSGDDLGIIQFFGADGTDANSSAASIKAEVDGTPGSNDMPGRLVFSTTADGASSATERMRIQSDGTVKIGTGTGNPILMLNASTSGTSVIQMGDSDDNNIGQIQYANSDDSMRFFANNSERMRIDSSGRLLVGTSSSVGPDNFLQLVGDVNDEAAITCWRSSDDAGSGGFNFIKTRGSVSSPGVTSNGDSLGILRWHAHDGSTWDGRAAQIEAKVDGGVAAGDTPGRLMFSTTADGASSPTERMRIDSSGNVAIGPNTQGHGLLTISKSASSAFNALVIQQGNTGSTDSDGLHIGIDSAVDAYITHKENRALAFGTANNERMRIDASGRLLIGVTSGDGDIGVIVNKGGTARILLARVSQPSTSGGLGSLAWGRTNGEVGCTIGGVADNNWSDSSYPTSLRFSLVATSSTSLTERMRIAQNGEQRHFGTNATNLNIANSASANNNNEFLYCQHSSTGLANGTNSFRVSTNGNVTNTNNSYGAISDQNLKENIVDATSQWNDIKNLQVRKYNFRENTGHETYTQLGLIAQEAESVSPGLVRTTPVKEGETVLDADGNQLESIKSINYSVLYMKAVKALQEAIDRIETLETSNADLLARVTALES